MLIIIEGPDGTGKTTLVKTLKSLGVIPIAIIDKDAPNQYNLWRTIITACAEDDQMYAMDRSFLSDWAYRLVMNDREPNVTLTEIVELLSLQNVNYVFCENKNAYKNAVVRGENYVKSEETHAKLTIAYDFIKNTLLKFMGCGVFSYDYTKDRPTALLVRMTT